MKKLVLGFVIAVSLTMGLAGAAGATQPDCDGSTSANSNALSVAAVLGNCDDHPVGP